MLHIALNGLGRIGKNIVRLLFTREDIKNHISLVALNSGPASLEQVVHSLRYDSLLGPFPGSITVSGSILSINNHPVQVYTQLDPEKIPWKNNQIDWVIEASGKFKTQEQAYKHITAGAGHVLITAPSADAPIIIIPGVNMAAYTDQKIVSLGSCTTNALAPLLYSIDQACGIKSAFFTTIHAYTNDQVLLDVEHQDMRRSRAAAFNIIPTTTGARNVIGKVIPHLAGFIDGCSVRVPVAKVSLLDLVCQVTTPMGSSILNKKFKEAAEHHLKGIMAYETNPLVSSDFSGNAHSVIVDSLLTHVVGDMLKVYGWYDNEWGYSNRLIDFLVHQALRS